MKAAYYEQMGSASDVIQFGDLPLPEPKRGEVRVKIRWSGINPSDCKSRVGLRNKNMPYPRIIPHSDGMGVIDAVGVDVTSHYIGQRVWLWNAARGRSHGTASEYLCIPASQAVELPCNVPDEVGACLGVPALTAMHAVLMDGGVENKTVLVTGGAGAVGHYAIQMAVHLGATRVLATVSSQNKAVLAKTAGADEVIFYKTESVPQRIAELTAGAGVDRIIELDIAANGADDAEMLRPGGDCVVYGTSVTHSNCHSIH
jgi:NADPH2:quinone reductase